VTRRARLDRVARAELRDASNWMAGDNRRAARRFRRAVDQAALFLAEHPFVGADEPDLAKPPYRVWHLKGFPYLVVYRPEPAPVTILRIVHTSRDLQSLLRDYRK
jgi:toxin ParE1/3/4